MKMPWFALPATGMAGRLSRFHALCMVGGIKNKTSLEQAQFKSPIFLNIISHMQRPEVSL